MTHRKSAPYRFYGQTTSVCDGCLELVPAKIVLEDDAPFGSVYYLKRCRQHGMRKVRVSSDIHWYKRCLDFIKPGDRPLRPTSSTTYGCPFDCGLCPDHEQHSCLALIEVNDVCNLACPVCFSESSPDMTLQRSLDQICSMMDLLVQSEGEPDLLQISGGEPTLHPDIVEILLEAKRRPIRHLMLNTNGIRIAQDAEFVERLALLKPGFEIYLQFDSLRPGALKSLRGADLVRVRKMALEHLEAAGISTTLVVVVKRGVNEQELGEIVQYALEWKCVRGVTFQPIQDVGRNVGFDADDNRILLSDIRQHLIDAKIPFGADDIIPVPCNPESLAIAYGLRQGNQVVPLTRYLPQDLLVNHLPNAITFEKYPELHRKIFDFFSLATVETNQQEKLQALLCCLPQVPAFDQLSYENTFRIAIIEFMDAHNFCISRVKRSCIHFVTPDRHIIPFETYNLFYRNGRIHPLRAAVAV